MEQQKRRRWPWVAGGVVAALAGIGALMPDENSTSVRTEAPSSSAPRSTLAPRTTAAAPITAADTTATPTTIPTTLAPATTVPSAPMVVAVVDGDTVDLDNGERVRLVGIDAPEVGALGYAEATAALSAMVLNRPVVLTPGAVDDRDSYGRLLRYVDVDGGDTGLALISAGLAVARYDSRDGYGAHPRESSYVVSDAASAPAVTLPPPPLPPADPGGGVDPRFGTCKEAIANGYGNYVAGLDPEYDWYRDADSDGVVCE